MNENSNSLQKESTVFKINDQGFEHFQQQFLSKRQISSSIDPLSLEDILSPQKSKLKSNLMLGLPSILTYDFDTKKPSNSIKNSYKEGPSITAISFDAMARKNRQKRVKLELENIVCNEKPTLATNIRNSKFLENHLLARNSTVMPFVKKFLYKLRNSTSSRDVSQLKEVNFEILNDKSYFYKEEKFTRDLSNSKGTEFIFLKAKNFGWELNFLCKSSSIIIFIKNFLETNIKVFHPYQNLKIFWDILNLMMIGFWLCYLPLMISFYEANYYSLEYLKYSLIFIFLDIMITLNSAYFKSGILEKSRSKIIYNYLKTNLIMDILTITPLLADYLFKSQINSRTFDCLEEIYQDNCPNDKSHEAKTLFFLLRKLHYCKLLIFLKLRDFKIIYTRILEKFLIQEKFQNILSLIQIAFISLLFTHIIGCFWHFIAEIQFPDQTWLTYKGLEYSHWLNRYLYSIYWSSVTIMTVGYGDIVPQNDLEVFCAMITIIFGCGVYAFNLNSIGIILHNINKENTKFTHNINIINQFMKRKKVCPELQMRVREYLRYIWKEEKAQNLEEETQIINVLSGNLKEELLLEAYGEILRKFPIFYANFSEKALKKAVHFIKDCKFIPEELIYDEGGSEDPSIYFIMKGEVEIYANRPLIQKENAPSSYDNTKEILLNKLKPGDFFGEVCFFTGSPRLASARSMDFTTLFSIKRSDFENILRSNDNFTDDYDKFCMIRDQISLYQNYNSLRTRCFSCNQLGHLSNTCSLIHYVADYEKIIKTHNYQIDQQRQLTYKRRNKTLFNTLLNRKKVEKSMIFWRDQMKKTDKENEINKMKNIKGLMRNLTGRMIFEEDSSLEEDDEEDDEKSFIDHSEAEEDDSLSNKENNESYMVPENEENELKTIENTEYLTSSIKKPIIPRIETDDNLKSSIMSSSKKDLMQKSMAGIGDSCFSQKSLKLPEHFKGYRHSALEIMGAHKQEGDEEAFSHIKSENENNSKIIKKRKELLSIEKVKNSPIKSNLKNFNKEMKISVNSLHKKKSSILSKFNEPESIFFLSSEIMKHSTIKNDDTSKSQINSIISPTNLDDLIKTIECFEKVKIFKNYFPENNLNKLIPMINSQGNARKSFQDKHQKIKKLETRLSKYTFFAEEMKNKMPDFIMRRIRHEKLSKNKLLKSSPNLNNNDFLSLNLDKKSIEIPSPNSSLKHKRAGFFKEDIGVDNKMKFVDLTDMIMRNSEIRKKLKLGTKKTKRNFWRKLQEFYKRWKVRLFSPVY